MCILRTYVYVYAVTNLFFFFKTVIRLMLMDKYLLPYFFSNVKPTVFVTTKSQHNQKNIIYSSNNCVFLPKTSTFLPVDITSIDLGNNRLLIVYSSRPTQNSTLVVNSLKRLNFRPFGFNTGLNWPLRELVEFFGLKDLKIQDNRNLLLDYSVICNPLKKKYPCEGTEEIYFNFLNQGVRKFKIFFIEL